MIDLENVSITYAGSTRPSLDDVMLHIPEGELVLVAGRTGSGKSTLLGTLNNLVPRFTGGTRTGRLLIDGVDVTHAAPRDLADRVGYVGQDPVAGFVTDTVESELAFGLEQLGVAPATMRTRVEETLDLLGIADLRRRALRTLSGGQQQRVAIGAVLTAQPRVLVLDEPTSALDPVAAEDVIGLLSRLVNDLAITVVIAEHRMERVVERADALCLVKDGRVTYGDPQTLLADAEIVPPVVDLGRRSGWSPLPLTVRAARRHAATERSQLTAPTLAANPATPATQQGLHARGIIVKHGPVVAVAGVDLDAPVGEVTALMGRNGSGKSSLLWAVQGSGTKQAGTVTTHGDGIALVPQTASDLLFLASVAEELDAADASADTPGAAGAILDDLAPGIDRAKHPRDLSLGQQLALVLAIQLVDSPAVLLLDEPTRGLDYEAKAALNGILRRLARDNRAIVVATHDVEFVAHACDRVVLMAEAEIVATGPTREVIAASPLLAPQMAKVYSPVPLLTVDEVVEARQR